MEDLKAKFIVSEEIGKKRIEEFVRRLLPFCKVTKSGGIIVEKAELSNVEKLKISLTARYLANHLDHEIPSEVNADELSASLMIPKDQVMARLKEATDEKFAARVKKGVYRVNPLRIDVFIGRLENRYKVENDGK